MKLGITDIHNTHGLTFKLIIERENSSDKAVFEQLQQFLSGEDPKEGKSALCSYEISTKDGRIEVGFAKEMKLMAKVNYHWNTDREDQKFVVLMLEGDPNNYQWDLNQCPHFECHWCHKETWGIERLAIEVYDPEEKKMKLVQAHDECQERREKQMATIPFIPHQESTPIDECAQGYCHHDEH